MLSFLALFFCFGDIFVRSYFSYMCQPFKNITVTSGMMAGYKSYGKVMRLNTANICRKSSDGIYGSLYIHSYQDLFSGLLREFSYNIRKRLVHCM